MQKDTVPEFAPSIDPFLFPKLLHGSRNAVRRNCINLQRRAEQTGNWAEALAGHELVSVEDDRTPFVMSISRLDGPGDLWHRYWIGEILVERTNDDRLSLINQLTLAGLDYCWFALGVLTSDQYSVPMMCRDCCFFREMLRRYVYWIPELRQLGQRCVRLGDGRIDPFIWQSQMVRLAMEAFDLWDEPEWERLQRSYWLLALPDSIEDEDRAYMNDPEFETFDGVELLKRAGIIAEEDARYEVVRGRQ